MADVKGLYQASAVHCVQRFLFSNYLLSLFVEFFNVDEEIFSLIKPSFKRNEWLSVSLNFVTRSGLLPKFN